MTKQKLIETFYNNHQEMIDYVNTLTEEQFTFSNAGKWTAGQQLSHVYLTLLPFPKVLPSKEFILQKFGKVERPTWNYDTVIEKYLNTSLQAPQQFLPAQVGMEERTTIAAGTEEVLQHILQHLNNYTEEELDTLALPHPLLGLLSVREMFYLMAYHATHHLKQTKQNLNMN